MAGVIERPSSAVLERIGSKKEKKKIHPFLYFYRNKVFSVVAMQNTGKNWMINLCIHMVLVSTPPPNAERLRYL